MHRLVADAFNMLGNAKFLASQSEENPIRKADKVCYLPAGGGCSTACFAACASLVHVLTVAWLLPRV